METMFIFLAFLVGLFFGGASVMLWLICYSIGRSSKEKEEKASEQDGDRK